MSEAALRVFALPRGSLNGRRLVLWSIALLVVIRFFTEKVAILPSATKLIDVPIMVVLLGAAAFEPAARRVGARSYFIPGFLLLLVAVVSTLVNISRVAPGPLLLFVYAFLAPLAAHDATYRLWPTGNAWICSRLFVALGIVQLVVVAAIDLPRFLSSGDPDRISGTFGENPYQLVFFLLVFCALVAAIAVYEPGRLAGRAAPLLVVCALGAVFLAQYRALLVAAAFTVVVVGIVLGRHGPRGAALSLFVLAAFAGTLAFVSVRFPSVKYQPYLAQIQQSPAAFVRVRIDALGGVGAMFDDLPGTIPVGSGPGTFSSRAWQTFANPSGNRKREAIDPVAQLVTRVTGGTHYDSDVADKYSLPREQELTVVLGSRALQSPFSSYSSLLAEVGLVGFIIVVGTYLAALLRTLRLLRVARLVPGQHRALLVATFAALLVLLEMAFLGNWLEVTRITLPAWMLLAVASKETVAAVTGR